MLPWAAVLTPLARKRAARGLLLLAVLAALWGFVIEPSRLVVRRASISVEGLPPMTIALLSDIHAGCNFVDEARMREVVGLINEQQPDLVALLGDYVTENRFAAPIPIEVTARILGGLRAPSGVFAVLGNHDWWHDGPDIRRALEGAGVRVLEGELALVSVRQQRLWLLGIPDAHTRGEHVDESILKAAQRAPVVALTHSPDAFPRVPRSIPLTLAGHTHGGQVRLPLIGSPVVPSRHGQRYALGHFLEEGRHLYVTSGLGMSILPVRFGVPPEVVILAINP